MLTLRGKKHEKTRGSRPVCHGRAKGRAGREPRLAPLCSSLSAAWLREEAAVRRLHATGCPRGAEGRGEPQRAPKLPGGRRVSDLSVLLSFVPKWFLAARPQSAWLVCVGPAMLGWPPGSRLGPAPCLYTEL